MAEPFFRMLEIVVPRVVNANGPHLTIEGLENIPEHGGAVLALNHTSYLDWYPGSIAALRRGRRLRFMIKAEMTRVPVVSYVIRHVKLIPVDRSAGSGAYDVAVRKLRDGELVGLHPEATISRSFELREFKTGAVRMAAAAGVPIIPVIVWGIHRVWTKDHPKHLWRNHIPVLAKIGTPITPSGDIEATTAELRDTMVAMLEQAQLQYPHPSGAYWVPRRLGGSAPTMAEALRMREAELAERDRKRLKRGKR
ncbi:lysophospholipid acyltransferase family protein [Mycolicibacter sp. MYC123]|uniref:Lysophospholipid acyltransferase family protein n=2 Tax=Mycolicibacter TaxID=1073531 RepID=A0ABU5YHK4_9MYCO|nr:MULTISPECIES: lysophospholipid acyltransferase family protein [unclassified Mycolicibacter]MEB3049527.1 lysophospholipid acyltransferase family protein [Mycolicibacter sp. MYC123]MEB3064634.1 lysophospholipid acyltransferase family protein [Mycolicibacter sp. MYC101]MEB3071600.1 lysophospholipid acyltransferase family protein [Mycolicibacter sp. MYC017]